MAVPFHLIVFKEFRNPIDVGSTAMMGFRATNLLYDIIPYLEKGLFLAVACGRHEQSTMPCVVPGSGN
jgi:hypothetical protein